MLLFLTLKNKVRFKQTVDSISLKLEITSFNHMKSIPLIQPGLQQIIVLCFCLFATYSNIKKLCCFGRQNIIIPFFIIAQKYFTEVVFKGSKISHSMWTFKFREDGIAEVNYISSQNLKKILSDIVRHLSYQR